MTFDPLELFEEVSLYNKLKIFTLYGNHIPGVDVKLSVTYTTQYGISYWQFDFHTRYIKPWHYVCQFSRKKYLRKLRGKKFQTFHCSNFTIMKSLELFPRRFCNDFFLKISIHSAKVFIYKKCLELKSMWLHPCPVQNSAY